MKSDLIFTYKIDKKHKCIDFYLNDTYFWGGSVIYFNKYKNYLFYTHINRRNENISLLQDFIKYINQSIGELYKSYEIDVDKPHDGGHYFFKLHSELLLNLL